MIWLDSTARYYNHFRYECDLFHVGVDVKVV